jgi:hypothetical protein
LWPAPETKLQHYIIDGTVFTRFAKRTFHPHRWQRVLGAASIIQVVPVTNIDDFVVRAMHDKYRGCNFVDFENCRAEDSVQQ